MPNQTSVVHVSHIPFFLYSFYLICTGSKVVKMSRDLLLLFIFDMYCYIEATAIQLLALVGKMHAVNASVHSDL